MPKLQVNLRETREPQPVPIGEYDLTIASAEYVEEKNYILVSIGIDAHPDAPNIRHYVSFPKDGDDERKANMKNLMMKRFLAAFDIDYSSDEIDTDEWIGQQATLEVNIEENEGNMYNRLKLPRLKDDDEDDAPAPAAKAPVRSAAKAPPRRGGK